MLTPQLQSVLKTYGWTGSLDRLSGRVVMDSRQAGPGDIFVAVRGAVSDGHRFVAQAVARGAGLVVCETPSGPGGGENELVVSDSAEALGLLAHAAAGQPDERLFVMGVTGTNGKTTVAYLVRHILTCCRRPCGMIGTVCYDDGAELIKANNTTPDSLRLADLTARMVAHGLQAVVMECSSHGLHQRRARGLRHDAAAFTNLTGDHLDYHGTMEAYLAAKCLLFESLGAAGTAVLNRDDPASLRAAGATRARLLWYGLAEPADLRADSIRQTLAGTRFQLTWAGQTLAVATGLIGEHNVYNCLAATGLALAAGCGLEAIGAALGSFGGVPGRLERIADPRGQRTVLVDYAHTDDALNHALATLAGLCPAHLTVVFGCGGERDRGKRPRMAAVAQRWASRIIVTSDNPRREEPLAIIADIQAGFGPEGRDRIAIIPDRRQAIESALAEAPAGGVVLIAGKGHEDYQQIGTEFFYFDDRQTVRDLMAPAPRADGGGPCL